MKTALTFLLSLVFAFALLGQTTFHKRLNYSDLYSAISCPLSSGKTALGTWSYDLNFQDGSIILFDENNQLLWHREYGPLFAITKITESDNGFFALGIGHAGALVNYSVLTKLSANGSVIWAKRFEPGPDNALYTELISVPDGILLSGAYVKKMGPLNIVISIITRLNNNGNVVWSKSYFSGFNITALEAKYLEGNVIYACGNIRGQGCLAQIDFNTGEFIHVASSGGLFLEEFSSIEPTSDGNFILAGTSRSDNPEENIRPWCIKISHTGEIIWSKTYNLPGLSEHCRMAKSTDNEYVLAFSTYRLAIDENGNQKWAKNYGSYAIDIHATSDNGLISAGWDNSSATILKTDALGNVENACCFLSVTFDIRDFNPPEYQYDITTQDFEVPNTSMVLTGKIVGLSIEEYCQQPITNQNIPISLCKTDSVEINGVLYGAPNTIHDTVPSLNGGCDTIKVYELSLATEPFLVKTIKFCPGTSVNINGVQYTQPGTVSEMIPATTGCDTLLAYILQYAPLPTRKDTILLCQGDSVWLNGSPYFYPQLVIDTLPGMGNDCDTLFLHTLRWLNNSASTVTIQCPDDIVVNSSLPSEVSYPAINTSSDCPCPDILLELQQGLPSGSLFPIGTTTVCYKAEDSCYDTAYHTATCCFDVKVEQENACDMKQASCLTFELLNITTDPDKNRSYRVRVTNHCASPLLYTAVELPSSIEAMEPVSGLPYVSVNGRSYEVRNPSLSPFRSLRYKPLAGGISNGQSDIFEYTLPARSNPLFIHVAASLGQNAFYQSILNTFGCTEIAQNRDNETESAIEATALLNVFPNPSSGKLWLEYAGLSDQDFTLHIRNAQGVLVSTTGLSFAHARESINLDSSLPDGFYWLDLIAKDGSRLTGKFTLVR